jgi:hypothetical protein
MNTSDFRSLRAQYDPKKAETQCEPYVDPNAFVATLHRIGTGAAADCALAGLRVMTELMLAAERTRRNGAPRST